MSKAPPAPARYVIDLEFGSDFQKDVHLQIFLAMMHAMKAQAESKHAKNKVTITPVHDASR